MNILRLITNCYKSILGFLLFGSIILFLYWWQFINLKPYEISQSELRNIYQQHNDYVPNISFIKISDHQYKILFKSYDGDQVEGRVELPKGQTFNQWDTHSPSEKKRVFLGVSAMGRNYLRWWQDSFKGRPTLTQVNKIGAMALASNQMLVAIDARYHGTRKTPNLPLSKIMNSLHIWGERRYYEQMIINTVLDYKHLINALNRQFGPTEITVAGYSMGAQVSLILAATDNRIKNVLAIVPPYVDNKVARVAPINFVESMHTQTIMLLSANKDEHAEEEQNSRLFNAIASKNKQQITFNSGHILPVTYTEYLNTWFE